MKTYKSNIETYSFVKEPTTVKKIKITSPKDLILYLRDIWNNDFDIVESFYIIFLNRANNTIGYKMLSTGHTTAAILDVKLLAKYATNCLCSSVIIAHNHPSGNTNPSQADKEVTNKIKKALDLFDIKVLDHIILTDNSFYSFQNEGIL